VISVSVLTEWLFWVNAGTDEADANNQSTRKTKMMMMMMMMVMMMAVQDQIA
jgi:hypothetical protein